MKKIIILSILATLLIAQNPRVYSSLGDKIYASVTKVEKLKELPGLSYMSITFKKYVEDVKKLRENGKAIDSGDTTVDKEKYLKKLRELSEQYSYFERSVKSSFVESMQSGDNDLFSTLVNSGMLDIKSNKQEIINYYLKHSADINASGVIQDILDEQAAIQKKIEASQKVRRESKIERIRANQKAKEEALIKKLDEEVKRKKNEIRENQKKELSDI